MNRKSKWYHAGHHYILKIPGTGQFWWGMACLVGVILAMVLFLAGEKSVFKLAALYQEQSQIQQQLRELKAKNSRLTQQIEDLKYDPLAVERIAREELGMVRGDEIVYRFVPQPRDRKE